MNVNHQSATEDVAPEISASTTDAAPAHLAFRRIVVHEFTEQTEPETLRVHFHFRSHSKHIPSGRHAA